MNYRAILFLILSGIVSLPAVADDKIDFVRDVQPILKRHCYSCHGSDKQKSGLRLDVKSAAFKGGDGYGESIVPGEPDESPLIELVTSEDDSSRMPPEGEPLSPKEIETLEKWVTEGAVWPDGVDLVKLEDRLDHWSFKPVSPPASPLPTTDRWSKNGVDHFVLKRLEKHGLRPSEPADPMTWLRRVTFDLTGLPPTPDEVDSFANDLKRGEPAYAAVVDRLLKSPRYGERFAQHWLDIVRYADTHGFEVNTERPNAWPYRDYVIDAFNRDTPYDRFIKEQIVGDALQKDSATGFLVTASVLLPGQIGKDAPSIRLARQDALDEIVNNIGQTFLGLSVGCARCHDHKFDPISAKDYYSMQAFVSGVEYSEREINSPVDKKRLQAIETQHQKLVEIRRQLMQFVPLARPLGKKDRPSTKATNSVKNIESFDSMDAMYVRLTIHDSNLHPTLGLIEPCLDELEIWTDETNPRNIALRSMGTTVTASGSRSSANHQLQFVNDGRYGNSRSWMSDAKGRGWVLFKLPSVRRINKVVWSRDRNGKFKDRLPIAYTLQAGKTLETMSTLVDVPPMRAAVRPTMNTDRFPPVHAKRIRLTVLATNSLAPCIDELEVFNTKGENVALQKRGTTLKTSGDQFEADRHEPRFIHDGKYGNSRSWMSSTNGTGSVELTFPAKQEIDRVIWGRDRNGKYSDRLAVKYLIEVETDNGWQSVADSSDRHDWKLETRREMVATAGLSGKALRHANQLLKSQQQIQQTIQSMGARRKVFAGAFRTPDKIHLLRRGDPEQPADPISPAVPTAIGHLEIARDTGEQERRMALANWLADPKNPLTARVMVNRIWQWHFGTGLVETANDFGRNGTRPSHPELLDWLAQEFIRSGWSNKKMHRLIVLSSTYRQSSEYREKPAKLDANSRLLWRFPSRRLSGESIRDSMLAVSGNLNLKMGGRGFDLFNKRGGLTGFVPVKSFAGEGLRRMIYAHKVRRERDAVFGAFDCPDAGQSVARRVESTTPIQALNLFNSQFTIDQAEAFANRVEREVGDDAREQIARAYRLALGRVPAADELAAAQPVVRSHGLSTLCRVLFNSNEFLFLP